MANRYTVDPLCHVTQLRVADNYILLTYVDDDVTGLPVSGVALRLHINNGPGLEQSTTGVDGYVSFVYTSAISHTPYSPDLNEVRLLPGNPIDTVGSAPITWIQEPPSKDYLPVFPLDGSRGDTVAYLNWQAPPKCDERGFFRYDVLRGVNTPTPNVTLATNLDQLFFVDSGISNPDNYSYRVVCKWYLSSLTPSPTITRPVTIQLPGNKESWGMLTVHHAL